MSNFLIVLDIILLIIVLIIIGIWGWNKIQAKSLGGEGIKEELKRGRGRAQIMDMREKERFRRKNCLL